MDTCLRYVFSMEFRTVATAAVVSCLGYGQRRMWVCDAVTIGGYCKGFIAGLAALS